jgi:hypothetical protein
VTRVWIALAFLVVDLIGLTLLVRRRLWATLRWRWVAIGLGLVGAAYASLTPLPYGEKYRVVGFPLPAAAFEISTGADFVGPLTVPILCLDLILVAAIPLSALVLFGAFRGRQQPPEITP